MNAKFEFLSVWVLGLFAMLTKHDVLIYIAIVYNIIATIKNTPGAYKNIKEFKNKVYARMVKKDN
jgi:hypothetical protein